MPLSAAQYRSVPPGGRLLADAHHRHGHHARAVTCYEHALALHRESGDRYHEATVLTHLGDTRDAAGDRRAAGDAWRQALAVLDELGHPDADPLRGRLAALDERPLPASNRVG